jgi:hypothetical protein
MAAVEKTMAAEAPIISFFNLISMKRTAPMAARVG